MKGYRFSTSVMWGDQHMSARFASWVGGLHCRRSCSSWNIIILPLKWVPITRKLYLNFLANNYNIVLLWRKTTILYQRNVTEIWLAQTFDKHFLARFSTIVRVRNDFSLCRHTNHALVLHAVELAGGGHYWRQQGSALSHTDNPFSKYVAQQPSFGFSLRPPSEGPGHRPSGGEQASDPSPTVRAAASGLRAPRSPLRWQKHSVWSSAFWLRPICTYRR